MKAREELLTFREQKQKAFCITKKFPNENILSAKTYKKNI